ncbi:MAG TPA: hypothetical protein VJB94_04915 [Candidatus Nanoarchaeia archaeon]|nr:hypothetical protein [Candidatus Nanoarchaeia archaeon]
MDSIFVVMEPKFNRDIPFKNKRRNVSFKSLLEAGADSGLNVFLSRFNLFRFKNKRVSQAWVVDNGWKKIKNKKVDLVFYRGKNAMSAAVGSRLKKSEITMINHPELENICDDKLFTQTLFPDLMPKTFLINNHYDMQKVLYFIKTRKVVLKPRFGSYGRDVIIIDKSKLRNGIVKDTIIQEFIDSSLGFRKLGIKGCHDIRVVMVDGKIDHCYARIPAPGSYLANMSQGASKFYIDPEDLPSSVVKNLKLVESKVSYYSPRIYSADFMMNQDKEAKLVELNSKPGTMFYENSTRIRERFHKNIFKAIKKAL